MRTHKNIQNIRRKKTTYAIEATVSTCMFFFPVKPPKMSSTWLEIGFGQPLGCGLYLQIAKHDFAGVLMTDLFLRFLFFSKSKFDFFLHEGHMSIQRLGEAGYPLGSK